MRKLHVGCGNKFIEGYEHNDKYSTESFIDYKCDTKKLEVKDLSYDKIYARHWLEHLTVNDAIYTLNILKNKLKNGGVLHLIVPNLEFHAKQLLETGISKFTGGSNFSHDIAGFYGWDSSDKMNHKYGYTEQSLNDMLLKIGFNKIEFIHNRECDLEVKAYKSFE